MPNQDEQSAHDGHTITIVVNGREETVAKGELSFAEVVALAYPPPTDPNVTFTVTYRRGSDEKPEGTLVEGQSVKVKKRMIFNVSSTVKS